MEKLLFLDIETHKVLEWEELNSFLQRAFEDHLWDSDIYDSVEECYNEKAGLNAEFSRVICVSLGYEIDGIFKKMSLYGLDEVDILTKLAKILKQFHHNEYALAGHNINGFDIPYLCKRYIINGMRVPEALKDYENKPWEKSTVDTMQIWKFGGWQSVSLEVICATLNIKCKSTEISGNNMYRYKIGEIDFNELRLYCEEDVESDYLMYKHIMKLL